MKTKEHQQLEDTSESDDDTDPGLQDDRITAYHDTDEENNDNDELHQANIQLEQIHHVITDNNTRGGDGTLDNEEKTQQNDINSEQENTETQLQQRKQQQEEQYGSYYNQQNLTATEQFNIAMMRIWDLLSITTSSFLLYLCLTLNGLFFFIGALSSSRNLGYLWFRADYDEEFEYSFGWHKSHELEGDWTPVEYKHLDGYFNTNLVESGSFVLLLFVFLSRFTFVFFVVAESLIFFFLSFCFVNVCFLTCLVVFQFFCFMIVCLSFCICANDG